MDRLIFGVTEKKIELMMLSLGLFLSLQWLSRLLSVEMIESKLIENFKLNPDLVRVGMFTLSGYEYLYKILEVYNSAILQNCNLSLDFPLWQHQPEKDLFSALVYEGKLNDASYTQNFFFAQTEYLFKCEDFEIEYFRDWMRVIRNIVSRGDVTKAGGRVPPIIRSPEAFDGVINLISELSEVAIIFINFFLRINQNQHILESR